MNFLSKKSKEDNKEKLLRIGDIVIIRYNDKLPNSNINFESIVTPEFMISKSIFCNLINTNNKKGNSIYKQALFKLENNQTYTKQNQLEFAKKEILNERDSNTIDNLVKIEELSKRALDEIKGNQSEFDLNFTNEITYGQIIQFRNIFTNELLTVENNIISKEIGCLDVSLSKLGGPNSWFFLKPYDKIRKEGDVVSYSDSFLIKSCATKTDFYLNVYIDDIKENESNSQFQVNLSGKFKIFSMFLFESAKDYKKNLIDGCIKNADHIRIFNSLNNSYLVVTKENIKYMLPSLYSFNPDDGKNENEIGDSELKKNNFKIYFEKDIFYQERASSYWEIQYHEPEKGLNLKYKMPIRLRNISTGYYLGFYPDSSEIFLTKNASGDDTLFLLYSDNKDNNFEEADLLFNSQVNLLPYNTRTKMYLSIDVTKTYGTRLGLYLSSDPYNYCNMVFKIEDTNHIYSKFTYNIFLCTEHLIELYKNFNEYGMIVNQKSNQGLKYDFKKSKDDINYLKGYFVLYEKILHSIQLEAIDNKPGSVNYKKLQEFYSEQGILTLLLLFIRLFDLKSNLSIKKEHIYSVKIEETPFFIFSQFSKQAIRNTFEIIIIMIENNSYACKMMYNDLMEMFTLLSTSHNLYLLKIIYHCFQSTKDFREEKLYSYYTSINFWKDLIKPINENLNIEEQTYYIKIINMLCLDSNGKGITESQTEVKVKLFEKDIIPLKFGLEDEVIPYFYFYFSPNTKSNNEFLQENPSLKYLIQSNEKLIDGKYPKFYFSSFMDGKYKKFLDYICSVLELYEVVCRSRNETMIEYLSKIIKINENDFIWNVINDIEIPIEIRIKMNKILLTFHIDIGDFMRITEYRNRCYKWEDININDIYNMTNKGSKDNKERKDQSTSQKDENEIYILFKWNEINDGNKECLLKKEKIIGYILNIWTKSYDITQIINVPSIDKLLLDKTNLLKLTEYLYIIFIITKDMCDLGYFSKKEINEIMKGISYFFMIFEIYKPRKSLNIDSSTGFFNTNDYEKNNHWLTSFAILILDSEYVEVKSILFKLYEISISILNIIIIIKEDMQILYFLKYFKKWNTDGESLFNTYSNLELYFNIISFVDLFNFEIEEEDSSQSEYNSNLNKDSRKSNTINYNKGNNFGDNHKRKNILYLDMYLLGVLFNDYDNEFIDSQLDNMSMRLLVKYFNFINSFKSELSTIELIINEEDTKIYEQILITSEKLKELKTRVINTFIENSLKHQGLRQNNNSLVNDIVRTIETDLINKLNIKKEKNLSKIQNIMKHLKLHEVLTNISDSLEKFDKTLIIYNVIYKFLYLFSYKNYQNQEIILKSRFDYLLERIDNFQHIKEILIEVFNVIKDSNNVTSYIEKIFKNIISNEIISAANVIDVLKSITLNYDSKNILYNQEVVFKMLIERKGIIKFFNNKEEMKELNEMIDLIRLDKQNKKVEKKLYSYIKVIELISSCCFNNLFCTMNCRRLIHIDDIVNILLNNEVPYMIKSSYLELIYKIYFIHDQCSDSYIHIIFDIVNKLILVELNLYPFYIQFFIDIYKRILTIDYSQEKYDRTNKSNPYNIIKQLEEENLHKIRSDFELVNYLINDNIDLDRICEVKGRHFKKRKFLSDNKQGEYWSFIYKKSSNNSIPSQGVLIFLQNILVYIVKFEWNEYEYIEILVNLRKLLSQLMNDLSRLEEYLDENDVISEIQYNIHYVISLIPKPNDILKNLNKNIGNKHDNFHILIENEANMKQKDSVSNAFKVLNEIKTYIIEKNSSVNEIFNLLDTDQDKLITKFEFSRNLKLLFKEKLKNEEIDDALNIIDSNKDNTISLREFVIKFMELYKSQTMSKREKIEKEEKGEKNEVFLENDKTDMNERNERLAFYKVIKCKDNNKENYNNIKEYINLNSTIDDKSYKIKRILKYFIYNFNIYNNILGHNKEMLSLVVKLNKFLDNERLSNESYFKKFINQLESKDELDIIFLLQILSKIISNQINKGYSYLNDTQNQLNFSGVTLIAMNLIRSSSSNIVIEESLNLLISLLTGGNINVQKTIFDWLQNPSNSFNFFSYIRNSLHNEYILRKNEMNLEKDLDVLDIYNDINKKTSQFNLYSDSTKILYKNLNMTNVKTSFNAVNIDILDNVKNINIISNYSNKESKYSICRNLLIILQLLCENCFEPFQNFIREQDFYVKDKDKISSINIVYEVGNFLINLLNFGQIIYSNTQTLAMIHQSLLTLSDFCLGPCETNQILLGTRRTLLQVFNNLIKYDINFTIKETINSNRNMTFCKFISFLKSIINSLNTFKIGKVILDEVDIYLLIEKVIDIHHLIILPNYSKLIQGRFCSHHVDVNKLKISNQVRKIGICKENQCCEDLISKNEMIYIRSGFDIFIILTYLQDIFPDNHKLSLFKLKLSDMNLNSSGIDLNTYVQKKKDGIKKRTLMNRKKSSKGGYNKTIMSKKTIKRQTQSGISIFCRICQMMRRNKVYSSYMNIDNNNLRNSLNSNSNDNNPFKREGKGSSFNNLFKRNDESEEIQVRFYEKYLHNFRKAFVFYAENISNVEIIYRNSILKIYFPKPFVFNFLSHEFKKDIIWKCKYNSHQARFEEIFSKIDNLTEESYHQQKIKKYKIFSYSIIRYISLLFIFLSLTSNVLLFVFMTSKQECVNGKSEESDETCSADFKKVSSFYIKSDIYSVIEYILFAILVLNILVTSIHIVNKYPLMNLQSRKNAFLLTEYINKVNIGKYTGSIMFNILNKFLYKLNNVNKGLIANLISSRIMSVLTNMKVIKNILYISLCVLSLYINIFFSSFLLVEIIVKFKYTKNLILNLLKNTIHLFSVVIILSFVLYLYSIFGFYFLNSDFSNGNIIHLSCDSIYSCFSNLFFYGIRYFGGIGFLLEERLYNDSFYWTRVIFDFSFYVIVIIILLNTILSIIVSSYIEFRDISKKKYNSIKEYCLICGIQKYKFELNGHGWVNHYKYEHNIFSYIFYMEYVKSKNINDCDGVEKYIRACIEMKKYHFIPIGRACSLENISERIEVS